MFNTRVTALHGVLQSIHWDILINTGVSPFQGFGLEDFHVLYLLYCRLTRYGRDPPWLSADHMTFGATPIQNCIIKNKLRNLNIAAYTYMYKVIIEYAISGASCAPGHMYALTRAKL